MANNLTAVISADTSKFVEEVKGARYMLDKYVAEAKNPNPLYTIQQKQQRNKLPLMTE